MLLSFRPHRNCMWARKHGGAVPSSQKLRTFFISLGSYRHFWRARPALTAAPSTSPEVALRFHSNAFHTCAERASPHLGDKLAYHWHPHHATLTRTRHPILEAPVPLQGVFPLWRHVCTWGSLVENLFSGIAYHFANAISLYYPLWGSKCQGQGSLCFDRLLMDSSICVHIPFSLLRRPHRDISWFERPR